MIVFFSGFDSMPYHDPFVKCSFIPIFRMLQITMTITSSSFSGLPIFAQLKEVVKSFFPNFQNSIQSCYGPLAIVDEVAVQC